MPDQQASALQKEQLPPLSQEAIEAIAALREQLAAHRRTLAIYLQQLAELGGTAYARPSVINGIHQARAEIRRIKAALSQYGQPVEDLPDDEATPQRAEQQPAAFSPGSGNVAIGRDAKDNTIITGNNNKYRRP